MKKTIQGAVLASAVASMFAFAAHADDKTPAGAPAGKVKCLGLNSCAKQGACGGAGNACSGKNGCKGKGITMVTSEKECKDKKGTVVADKK